MWRLGNGCQKYLSKHGISMHFRSIPNVLMNNISKAFNNTILVVWDKPLLTIYEWSRQRKPILILWVLCAEKTKEKNNRRTI